MVFMNYNLTKKIKFYSLSRLGGGGLGRHVDFHLISISFYTMRVLAEFKDRT